MLLEQRLEQQKSRMNDYPGGRLVKLATLDQRAGLNTTGPMNSLVAELERKILGAHVKHLAVGLDLPQDAPFRKQRRNPSESCVLSRSSKNRTSFPPAPKMSSSDAWLPGFAAFSGASPPSGGETNVFVCHWRRRLLLASDMTREKR
jgi:hypothetical protein